MNRITVKDNSTGRVVFTWLCEESHVVGVLKILVELYPNEETHTITHNHPEQN